MVNRQWVAELVNAHLRGHSSLWSAAARRRFVSFSLIVASGEKTDPRNSQNKKLKKRRRAAALQRLESSLVNRLFDPVPTIPNPGLESLLRIR